MPDFIPGPDEDFDKWLSDLVTYFTSDPTAPVLSAADKTALTGALTSWTPAYTTHRSKQTAAQTAAEAKDLARTASETTARKVVGDVQRDPATTDTQRTAMKVTVPKGSRTPVPVVETHPVMQKIDTSTRLRHRLFFADSETVDSTAKPAGAKFCEIRMQLAGTAPVDPNTMAPLAMESRTPHRNDFDSGDEGKMAFYAMRWVNTTGENGPWGPVYNATVPG